eukprot:403353767
MIYLVSNFDKSFQLDCGQHCSLCNSVTGCESCPGEEQQNGWVTIPQNSINYTYLNFAKCQNPSQQNSPFSQETHCDLFSSQDQMTCLKCKPSYFVKENMHYDSSSNLNYNGCQEFVQGDICIRAKNESWCEQCKTGYSTYKQNQQKLCYKCDITDLRNAGVSTCEFYYNDTLNQVVMSKITGCQNGYYDQVQNICVPSCYFLYSNQKKQAGFCFKKSGTVNDTVYVKPPKYYTSGVQMLGTTTNPMFSIQDAIARAYERGAYFESAFFRIILQTSETHAMVRNQPWGEYLPQAYDQNSQNTKIQIETETGKAITVLYKLRDSFKFKVGGGLTIINLKFDAIDSVVNLTQDLGTYNCSMNYLSKCCSITQTSNLQYILSGGKSCEFQTQPTDQCYIPQGPSFIQFDIHPQTMLTQPPTLKLQNVRLDNFVYELNSMIELNSYGGHIQFETVNMDHLNTCGSIIRNKKALIKRNFTNTTLDEKQFYSDLSNNLNYNLKSQQENMFPGNFNPYAANCSNTIGSQKPCYSISINKGTIQYLGSLKPPNSQIHGVDPLYKLQYTGSVLDLEDFRGNISLTSLTIQNSNMTYQTCKHAKDIYENRISALDQFPSFGNKTRIQMRTYISVTKYADYKLTIYQVTMSSLQSMLGVIYLDLLPRTSYGRVLIDQNTLSFIMGLYESSVIFIRMRGPSGQEIKNIVPDANNQFCYGVAIANNVFAVNVGCHGYQGGTIRVECVNYDDMDVSANGYIPLEYNLTDQVKLARSNINSSSYPYLLLPTSYAAYSYNFYTLSINYNQIGFNSFSRQSGVINIVNVPRVNISDGQFNYNFDNNKDVIRTMLDNNGLTILDNYEDPSFLDIAQNASYDNSKLGQSLLCIRRATQVVVRNIQDFSDNFLIEVAYRTRIYWGQYIMVPENLDSNMFINYQQGESRLLLKQWHLYDVQFYDIILTGCVRPFFDVETLIFNMTNTIFTRINSITSNGQSQELSPFFSVKMRHPYQTYISGSTYITEQFILNNTKITYFQALNGSRLLDIKLNIDHNISYSNFTVLNFSSPNQSQILIDKSIFSGIYSTVNGGLARIKTDQMLMNITNSNFNNITSGFENMRTLIGSQGGVFYVEGLKQMYINNTLSSFTRQLAINSHDGGGQFLYLNQTSSFDLIVNNSQFLGNFPTNLSQSQLAFFQNQNVTTGSCFYVNTQDQPLKVYITSSKFSFFQFVEQGGALRIETSNQTKLISVIGSEFVSNVALKGGSLTCINCTLINRGNKFTNNSAMQGGDIFISEPLNTVQFESMSSNGSFAFDRGASIYYKDYQKELNKFSKWKWINNVIDKFDDLLKHFDIQIQIFQHQFINRCRLDKNNKLRNYKHNNFKHNI